MSETYPGRAPDRIETRTWEGRASRFVVDGQAFPPFSGTVTELAFPFGRASFQLVCPGVFALGFGGEQERRIERSDRGFIQPVDFANLTVFSTGFHKSKIPCSGACTFEVHDDVVQVFCSAQGENVSLQLSFITTGEPVAHAIDPDGRLL